MQWTGLHRKGIVGVYAIKNTENGKFYVGSSIDVRRRWYDHRWRLRHATSVLSKLQNSWNAYGESAFIFMILEEVLERDLLQQEQAWTDFLNAAHPSKGLNILQPSQRVDVDGRKQMSVRAEKRVVSAQTRAKMSASHKGKTVSAAHRANLSLSQKGRKLSDEHKQKLIESWKGRVMPEEQRAKFGAMAATRKGIPREESVKAKISAALIGHPYYPKRAKSQRRRENV